VTGAGPLVLVLVLVLVVVVVVDVPGLGWAYDVLGTGELLRLSVTNVIDTVLSKPAIGFWRGKMVADAAWEQAGWLVAKTRQVASLAAQGRHCEAQALQARTIAWLKRAPDRRSDHVKARGTGVHRLVEAHALGRPAPDHTVEEAAYLPGYIAFVDRFRPRFRHVEVAVVNLTHGDAGRADILVTFGDQPAEPLTVCDWKTWQTRAYPEVVLQLAALAHAEYLIREKEDGTRTLVPMPPVDRGIAVRLHPDLEDGYAVFKVDIGDDTFAAFLGLLAALPFARSGDRTLTGPIRTREELIA
jgi:hypothetical protein